MELDTTTNIVYLTVAMLISFIGAYMLTGWWVKRGREAGFVAKDMNKPEGATAVESGGIWVMVATVFGLLTYIAMKVYLGTGRNYLLELMTLALLLFMTSFIGFLDDILGWKKGLRVSARIISMVPIAIPLVVIKAGHSTMALPFIGIVDFGILYPLLIVPIGILGAANAFNMIAGYNGLEAGQGLLLMFFTMIYTYINNVHPSMEASVIMIPALLAFLSYNWYPAKVFPGNSFTYGMGAYYASLIVLGNFEKFGLLLFTLYFVELILFLRGIRHGVYKENFGIPTRDGITLRYDKIYSLTHLAIWIQLRIRGRATEKGVVYIILSLQTIVGILALIASSLI